MPYVLFVCLQWVSKFIVTFAMLTLYFMLCGFARVANAVLSMMS